MLIATGLTAEDGVLARFGPYLWAPARQSDDSRGGSDPSLFAELHAPPAFDGRLEVKRANT